MGTYVDTGQISNGKPVYQSEDTNDYLFFVSNLWIVGPDYGMASGYIANFETMPELLCPPLTGYSLHDGDDWDSSFDVMVSCAGTCSIFGV